MSDTGAHILVVDDEPNIRKLLAGVLADEGYRVSTAGDGDEARQGLATDAVDLVLLDVQLPGEDGLTLLRKWRDDGLRTPIVMMSGHGTISTAVEATRLGAIDFIEKPIQVERLLLCLANGLRLRDLRRENRDLRRAVAGEMIGDSEPIRRLRDEIGRIAPTDARVLITGENGTGKELVARALHEGSGRAGRPLVTVNCAAIPSELLESELFGHEKGAFTGAVAMRRGKFELAQRGTMLLDEVGDMNPTTQAKLLRVLEEREMQRVGGEKTIRLDVRVFASTNRELEKLVAEGGFRQDLYHRLKVVPVHVEPLRRRPGDVALLCEHYLRRFGEMMGRPERRLHPDALARLEGHRWPGNVRELRNLMERLVIMTDAEEIGAAQVAPLVAAGATPDEAADADAPLAERLENFERRLVTEAVDAAGGNIAAAARRLGIDRANLHRKLRRLGVSPRQQDVSQAHEKTPGTDDGDNA